MRLEISLHSVLIIFSVIVWLSAVYMKIVVRQLKKQINDARDIKYIGEARCESAVKNFNVLDKFYKVVVVGLLLLVALFLVDVATRMFAFFGRGAATNGTVKQLVSVNLILGILACSGFWYMVRDVRNYSAALVNKCKELSR